MRNKAAVSVRVQILQEEMHPDAHTPLVPSKASSRGKKTEHAQTLVSVKATL